MGFSFHDKSSMIEAAESVCFVPASTGSTSNVEQKRRDNEDNLQFVGIELHDDSDIW